MKKHPPTQLFHPLHYNEGFSYIEVIVVLAIMLILGGIIGLNSLRLIDQARQASAENQIAVFHVALSKYYFDCGRYPTEYQGLAALWEKPQLEPVPEAWNGPYLNKRPDTDPWNNEYYYSEENTFGLPYVIVSYGADGKQGGSDKDADIVSWE